MIIVTGGAGFIGSNLILGLNAKNLTDILVVDDLSDGKKFNNLVNANIADYVDLNVFREQFNNHHTFPKITAVFHLGACSDTTEWDGKYMLDNNYQYSKELLQWCEQTQTPFIYASSASVYGDGSMGFKENVRCEKPLNVYGYSKWLFDQWIRANRPTTQVVGLRYFNVYGPNETHKKHMASVAWHLIQQYHQQKNLQLFGEHDGYGAGEQKRDFIYVDDAVKINLWFLDNPHVSGIYNCGTGTAQTFNSIAHAIQNTYSDAQIEYIPFPEKLKQSYQSFTQADMTKLKEVGYTDHFSDLSQGVKTYLDQTFPTS